MSSIRRVKYPTYSDYGKLELPRPEFPLASINLEKNVNSNEIKVIAQFLMDRLVDDRGVAIEGAKFCLGMDGSVSMRDLYGTSIGPFGYGTENVIEPVVKTMIRFLSNYADDGKIDLVYWSVGTDSKQIEFRGAYGERGLRNLEVKRPSKRFGRRTYMMPILKAFIEGDNKNSFLSHTNWGMGIIITDGEINDFEEVKAFTEEIATKVAHKERGFTKLVLIGVGDHVNFDQINELDNLTTSVGLDIWDASYAREWQYVSQTEESSEENYDENDSSFWEKAGLLDIFSEVMSQNLIVARAGQILDLEHREIIPFPDGIPARLEFTLDENSPGFFLSISSGKGKKKFQFDLSEGFKRLKN